ncbi:MAG TPA: TetR family transcriptional regulator [Actinomycetota bacterium]|nr:TetR family transcriptional regulator [Actinomycetota bacterium]
MPTATHEIRTDGRILDAAFEAVATHGLSRLTMDDVARLAGLSRQTVYRYFPSKDTMIIALVAREEEAFIDGVRAANDRHERLEDVMREAILFSLETAREHPLLDRLLASEPEVLLPYLTTRGGRLVARARAVIEELARGRADVRPELVHRTADLAVRAIVSYVITPSEDDPKAIAAETARVLARALEDGGRRAR